MTSQYNTILETLPSLSRKELDEIRKRCAYLLQGKAAVTEGVEESDWLLEGIVKNCKKRGMYVGRSFHIKRHGSFASFATKSEVVREQLLEAAPGLSPVQKQYLGEVAADELAHLLRVGANLEHMLKFVHLVPEAIEKAFPGYMQSKLLGMVVRYDEQQQRQ